MTRYSKTSAGHYKIKGKTYPKLRGSRAQVFHENAYKTSGELTKHDLMKNKSGRIVSRKKHKTASREQRLKKHGYGARKGKFGAVRLTRRRSRKGGYSMGPLSPASVSGMADDSMSTDALQLEAGMAGGRRRRRTHRRKGGYSMGPLSPASVSGMADDSMSTDALQLEAGMAGGKRHRRSHKHHKRSSRHRRH